MKKLFLLIVLCVCSLRAYTQAPPVFYEEGRYFGVNAGYRHASLNAGDFSVGYIEGTCFPSHSVGWEFSTRIEYGKDYFSFEPVSAVGFLAVLFTQSRSKQFSSTQKAVAAICAVSSAKLPIKIWDWCEIDPYWNLLRLTKLYGSKLRIHADVGAQIKFYPFCNSYSMSTFYISPCVDYDFGYKKNAGDFIYETWGGHITKTNKSLFHGYSYSLQIGMYF